MNKGALIGIAVIGAAGFLLLNTKAEEQNKVMPGTGYSGVQAQETPQGITEPPPITNLTFQIQAPEYPATKKEASASSAGGSTKTSGVIIGGVNYSDPTQFRDTGNASVPINPASVFYTNPNPIEAAKEYFNPTAKLPVTKKEEKKNISNPYG